ncbi:MAG: hypothetical protein ACKOEY_03110, partial [Phenylobacterium sp.]
MFRPYTHVNWKAGQRLALIWEDMDMLDLIIRGGTVVDGTGATPAVADIGIQGDRIVAVGRVEGPARREIDARGLIVTPGWV